jgi:hypothetical protein
MRKDKGVCSKAADVAGGSLVCLQNFIYLSFCFMEKTYSSISSADYISQLDFHFAEIYSLKRGPQFEQPTEEAERELEELGTRKGQLSQEESARMVALNQFLKPGQYLVDEQGRFHWSSQKTHQFLKNAEPMKQFTAIMSRPFLRKMDWMCTPEFREAIVFYHQDGNIASVLHICLSCDHMKTGPQHYIDADVSVYEDLRAFFTTLGHKVEEN